MSTTQDLMGLGVPAAVAGRLGNTPATIAGVGTTQTGAARLQGSLNLLGPTASNTAFLLSNSASTGRPIWCWNTSSSLVATVFPPSGGTINGATANAGVSIAPLSGALFQLQNGVGVAVEAWGVLAGASGALSSAVPNTVYNAVATAPSTNNLNLTGANITGGVVKVFLNLTATLSAGATATLPDVGTLVTAMRAAGMNPVPGASYELDLMNTSSGNFAWTITTNTGWTLNGAMTAAQNTLRRCVITFTSLSAAVLQSVGEYAITAVV